MTFTIPHPLPVLESKALKMWEGRCCVLLAQPCVLRPQPQRGDGWPGLRGLELETWWSTRNARAQYYRTSAFHKFTIFKIFFSSHLTLAFSFSSFMERGCEGNWTRCLCKVLPYLCYCLLIWQEIHQSLGPSPSRTQILARSPLSGSEVFEICFLNAQHLCSGVCVCEVWSVDGEECGAWQGKVLNI